MTLLDHFRRSRRSLLSSLFLLLLLSVPALAAQPAKPRHHDPNALWRIVHDRCVPAARSHQPLPAPCVQVSMPDGARDGFVVIRDQRGVAQHLLMPTARISGIESPVLLRAGTPDYLADAWRARHWVEQALGRTLPRDQIGLAINSIRARSQNQLHIHVDCMNADVRRALDRMLPAIGDRWALLPQPLAGHPYRAMRVYGRQLHTDPVKLLARSLHHGQRMGRQTLVVVGQRFADGRDGFLLLAGRSDRATGDWGGGEELLDHQCHLAGAAARHSASPHGS